MMKKKVLVAMSGGVDSSVAAYLLTKQGYECIGCTMKLYDAPDYVNRDKTCCSLNDVEDARSVAYKLGMPYYVFNFTDDFKGKVIDKFIGCYESGITPNPCIDCNRFMKFDKLYERAKMLGCDYIATGHYVRLECRDGRYELKKAVDHTKDQSYVLYFLNQEQLAHTLFPLGELEKSEVRRIAEENGFYNALKPDSQDICFVPDGDYVSVIKAYTGKEYPEGDFVSSDGKLLGKHKGIINYTIGQRKGLGISSANPLFVKEVQPDTNRVILSGSEELFTNCAIVKDVDCSEKVMKGEITRCKAKIRYRHPEQDATITVLDESRIMLVFDNPQRAITKGQAAVLYDNENVIGGGTIEASDNICRKGQGN